MCFSVPDKILFYADKDKAHIGVLSLDVSTEPHILASSPMPVAIGYDPLTSLIYWSDVRDRAIYTINLDGANRQTFLNSSQGIGTVDGENYLSNRAGVLIRPQMIDKTLYKGPWFNHFFFVF